MTSLWPVGDGRSWWASEKPLRDAGSGQGKPTEDLGSKDLLLPKEAAESTPRPGKFSCPQRPAPSMQARGETATSDHLEPFLFGRKWTLRGGASLSNAAKCRVGKHLLRDRSPLWLAGSDSVSPRQPRPPAAARYRFLATASDFRRQGSTVHQKKYPRPERGCTEDDGREHAADQGQLRRRPDRIGHST